MVLQDLSKSCVQGGGGNLVLLLGRRPPPRRPPCLALYTRELREHKAPTEASDIPATEDHKYICSQKCALAWRTCAYHHDNIKW